MNLIFYYLVLNELALPSLQIAGIYMPDTFILAFRTLISFPEEISPKTYCLVKFVEI